MNWLIAFLTNQPLPTIITAAHNFTAEERVFVGTGPSKTNEEMHQLLDQQGVPITKEVCDQLLISLATLSGQEVSCQYLARHVSAPPSEIMRALVALEAGGVWIRLKCFDAAGADIGDRSKGYLRNPALAARLLRVASPHEARDHARWGGLFEATVVMRIARIAYELPGVELFHWRTVDGSAEVDLVLQQGTTLYPIEIKSSWRREKKNADKIALFTQRYASDYTVAKGVVIYTGEEYVDAKTYIALPVDMLY